MKNNDENFDILKTISLMSDEAIYKMGLLHEAREKALASARLIIQNSAKSIRATHRSEFSVAKGLISEVEELRTRIEPVLLEYQVVYFAGFWEDALKEYVEASLILAFSERSSIPSIEELNVGAAVYMNGLAEAAGEIRRLIMDLLREDKDLERCEGLLAIMDEIYTALVVVDFPDAVTRGLRRNTDMVRAVLERTRSDLTTAVRQEKLRNQISNFRKDFENTNTG